MEEHFDGRVALVTGGAQGIGKAITCALLTAGMRVAVADRDAEACQQIVREHADSDCVMAFPIDVADEAAVKVMFARILEHFGRLDALINNAGHGLLHPEPLEALTLEDWNRVLGTNLTGTFLCSKHAVTALRRSGGTIVNIASTRALQSEPNGEAYAASKGGVVALTHAMANSLGPEIRVNCISPGWIAVDAWQKSGKCKTPELRPEDHAQHPAGRVGHPGDIAELVVFLISTRAGFITGQNFIVDGGMTRKMIYAE